MRQRNCNCPDNELCQRCYERDRPTLLRHADALGQCLAERLCRGELRALAEWPSTSATLQMVTDEVAALTADDRMRRECARACADGAATWWLADRRGTAYDVAAGHVGRRTRALL